MLLFIFHHLKLLQRKTVLLTLAQTIIEVSPVVKTPLRDEQIHYLGRLLHFFEYMIKWLYEPPSFLVEQIDHNLFKSHLIVANNRSNLRDKDNNNHGGKEIGFGHGNNKQYFHARDIEESYEKFIEINPDCERIFIQSLKPRFYHLLPVDICTGGSGKDVPKLDGMSLNFILSGLPDSFTYELLYDSIISLLEVSNQVDSFETGNERMTQLGICAVNFTFNVTWRLMLQLPPSMKFIRSLAHVESITSDCKSVLQAILWIPRLFGNKWFSFWIRDSLVKMTAVDSPNESVPSINPVDLLQETGELVTSFPYSIGLITNFITVLIKKYKKVEGNISSVPSVFEMFVLESVIIRTLNQMENCLNGNDTMSERQLMNQSSGLISQQSVMNQVKNRIPGNQPQVCYQLQSN